MTKEKPHGRPPFRPTDEMRTIVETLCAAGFSAGRIAVLVKHPTSGRPISEPTIRKHFATELATGAASVEALAAGTLVQAMRRGSVTASTWWLTRRCGWREQPLEVTGPHGGPITHVVQSEAMAATRNMLDGLAARRMAGEDISDIVGPMMAVLRKA